MVWFHGNAKGVALQAEVGGTEHLVQADRGLLGRALIKLIDNAVRHSFPGSAVTCRIEPAPTGIAFMVQDQGPGLTPEQTLNLPNRIGSADEHVTASESVGGDLALVGAVALRHGGSVTCDSRPGKGVRFSLVIPRASSDG